MPERKTVGQLMEEMRLKAGAQNYHGHEYMDLERFAEDTRHMIIFDVLTDDSPVGWKGERTRLFLTEAGYGAFDFLAASVLRAQKKRYPQIELILVLAYLNTGRNTSGYDSTVYPPLETTPRRFAISHRNRWMVEASDVVVAYVLHDWGGAATTLRCAKQKKKQIISYRDEIGS